MKRPDWRIHLGRCYERGFIAYRDGSPCPYKAGGGSVQRQRREAWQRGYDRAKAGKPLCDYNG